MSALSKNPEYQSWSAMNFGSAWRIDSARSARNKMSAILTPDWNIPRKRVGSNPAALTNLNNEMKTIIEAPDWLKERMRLLSLRPKPTLEQVKREWKDSYDFKHKSTKKKGLKLCQKDDL